jgi:hypothetical protein
MCTTPRPTTQASRDGSGSPGADDPDVLREALELAELGLPVIPLGPRSKVPRIKRWQERASTDRRTIRRWFWGRPDDNLGLRTGGGLVALDVDADAGGFESYARLIEGRGPLPETARAETGSGGMHLLFRVEVAASNRVGLLPGLDIRGDGGQVVVAPSVHPETARPYVWIRHPREGIAPAPEWLVGWLTEADPAGRPPRATKPKPRVAEPTRAQDGALPATSTTGRPSGPDLGGRRAPIDAAPRRFMLTRRGDRAALAAAMIARFPVLDLGTRHDRMTRAVGHLIGQGFDPALVVAVMGDWHTHFDARGVVGTDADEAARELDACIGSTLRALGRGEFRPAMVDVDHEALCREIRLDAVQREFLASGIIVTDGRGQKTLIPVPRPGGKCPEPGQGNHCKRVTQIGRRLCESDDERAFVKALVVQVTHKLFHTREYRDDRVIRMTHDQLRRIAGERHGGLAWGPQQVERLKCKYISREGDGKPASRFELLREVRKGERKRGHARGCPSEYRPTGIAQLVLAREISVQDVG